MRKLLFLPLLLLTLNVLGQQSNIPPPPPPLVFVIAVQMGTDTVKNGIDTVRLVEATISEMNEAVADTNYTVIMTPRGDFGQFALIKTTRFYFIIKEQGGSSPKPVFDYVVYAKQTRPWMPMQHRRPPGQ